MFSSISQALLLLAAPAATAPEAFFVGRTEGAGTVNMIMSGSHKVRDHSRGRLDKSGALILEQIVEEEGKPTRRRSWRLVRAGAAVPPRDTAEVDRAAKLRRLSFVVTFSDRATNGPPIPPIPTPPQSA